MSFDEAIQLICESVADLSSVVKRNQERIIDLETKVDVMSKELIRIRRLVQ